MAKFIYEEGGDHPHIVLDAKQGEEIPVDIAQAWALIRLANKLGYAGDCLIDVANSISDVANK